MVNLDISTARSSDMSNVVEDYSVAAQNTDAAGNQDETEWINSKWSLYWGYFNSIPELKTAIVMKAIWNVGKGYDVKDPFTKAIIDHIRGWGKDTFDDIMFNMEICRRVGGDAFAEIIRLGDKIVNLKVLDPGSIKIIVNRQGIIKRYEQINKIAGEGKVVNKFEPDDIFHLSNNRLADQIHGISDIEALEQIILAEGESFTDIKKVMHRQAKPFIIFKLKTDVTAKIDALVAKIDQLRNKGEDLFIPDDEDIISYDVVQVNVNAVLLAWRDDLRNKFYRSVGLPQIVPGGSGQSTESESKVIYLAFEQLVEKDQRFLEKQILNQLGWEIDFIPPATLQQNLQADSSKDGSQGLGFQPNELQAGVGQ